MNTKVKVGDRIVYTDGEVAPVIEIRGDRRFAVRTRRFGVCIESLKADGGDVDLFVEPDKLQQLLEDVRKARAAEHAARKNVAAAKASVKPSEASYVEAQRARQVAVDKLLAELDAQA